MVLLLTAIAASALFCRLFPQRAAAVDSMVALPEG